MVRKKLTAREGRGWLSGTLFCTHFRVAFVPQDAPKPDVSTCPTLHENTSTVCGRDLNKNLNLLLQDNADPVLLGDHDVALASIEKVVVGKSSFLKYCHILY